jgi:hypothetical protein
MRATSVLERLSALGAAAQATVPGVYAWGVTVAPAAWAHGSSVVAKVASILGLLALAGGVVGERRWGGTARVASLWGFVLACALAWSATPAAFAPLRIDAPRGIAGMIGWGLFALASAAPALQGRREEERITDEQPLRPRKGLARGDALYLAFGALAAGLLQLLGWHVATPERALLVRFVGLAAGLGIIGAATEVALARHRKRAAPPTMRRLRRAMYLLVALGILGMTGLLFAFRA